MVLCVLVLCVLCVLYVSNESMWMLIRDKSFPTVCLFRHDVKLLKCVASNTLPDESVCSHENHTQCSQIANSFHHHTRLIPLQIPARRSRSILSSLPASAVRIAARPVVPAPAARHLTLRCSPQLCALRGAIPSSGAISLASKYAPNAFASNGSVLPRPTASKYSALPTQWRR